MGRTLQNTMINLGLQNACDEAIYQVRRGRDSTSDTHTHFLYFVMKKYQQLALMFPSSVARPGHGGAGGDGGGCRSGERRPRQAGR